MWQRRYRSWAWRCKEWFWRWGCGCGFGPGPGWPINGNHLARDFQTWADDFNNSKVIEGLRDYIYVNGQMVITGAGILFNVLSPVKIITGEPENLSSQ